MGAGKLISPPAARSLAFELATITEELHGRACTYGERPAVACSPQPWQGASFTSASATRRLAPHLHGWCETCPAGTQALLWPMQQRPVGRC